MAFGRRCTTMLSQLYRKATIGIALADSLEELVNSDVISEELAEIVMEEYDRVCAARSHC